MRKLLLLLLASLALPFIAAAPAAADPVPGADGSRPTDYQVEASLDGWGLPVGQVNRHLDAYSYRGVCAWRELTGHKASRSRVRVFERRAILGTRVLSLPKSMVVGVNVSRECQVAYWVVRDKSGQKKLKAVFPVSTGMSGHTTPAGVFRINREINGWHESTLYVGAMMYRPKYFNGGVALHGSYTDSLVLPYPASHGCVRMLHKDIDRLWRAGIGPGATVRVY